MAADNTGLRVLHVDDDDDYRVQTQEQIAMWNADEPDPFLVNSRSSFDEALKELEGDTSGESPYDVVLLDISDGDKKSRKGRDLLNDLKQRLFVEVIIFSAYVGIPEVQSDRGPFVQTVAKDDWEGLHAALKTAASSKALRLRKKVAATVLGQLRETQAQFFWNLAETDRTLYNHENFEALAQNLASRLAVSIANPTDQSAPQHFYTIPPLTKTWLLGGDLLKGSLAANLKPDPPGAYWQHNGYWAVVTASCDFENGKAQQVTLAVATPLEETAPFKKWYLAQDKYSGSFSEFLQNRSSMSLHFLPSWFVIPNLVVDFECTVSIPKELLQAHLSLKAASKRGSLSAEDQIKLQQDQAKGLNIDRVASLNSPFAEHLTSRYGYRYGRIGVPELNASPILAYYKNVGKGENEAAAGTE